MKILNKLLKTKKKKKMNSKKLVQSDSKKKFLVGVSIIITLLLVILVLAAWGSSPVAENIEDGDYDTSEIVATNWYAQVFMVPYNLSIDKISLNMTITSFGNFTIGIRNVTGTNVPSVSPDIINMTVNSSTLVTGWNNFTMPDVINNSFVNYTNYSIVFRCPGCTVGSLLVKFKDASTYGYPFYYSGDSGSSYWITDLPGASTGGSALFQVFAVKNLVILNYPSDNYKSILNDIQINCSGTLYSSTINNISLWRNETTTGIFHRNKTNTTISLITNTTLFNSNFSKGTYLWTCEVCSTDGTCGFGENRTITFSNFVENSQSYNTTSSSSKLEGFAINFTYNTSYYSSVSGMFNYNGILYSGTLSGSGDTRILTTSLITPSASLSYPFFWNISLTNSTGTTYLKSYNYTQTISALSINLCNETYNVPFINFSIKDAETITKVVNATFKASFNYGLLNTNLNYSYQDLSEGNSSFAFCFLPSDLSYTVSANVEYESTNYAKNYYYLTNSILTNRTENITLYLLNDTQATTTILKAQTDTQQPISDAYIQIQKYDAGTDTYFTVGMGKTDFNGEDVAYLNWYDTFYKYILTKNDEVIYIAPASKISATPVSFIIPFSITYDYDKFLNIVYSLTFNNATNNFILTYSVPSGQITSGCLNVIKRTPRNDTTICDVCETSSSATVYCNIDGYGNGTYIGSFYATGSLGGVDSLTVFVGAVNELYDLIGNIDGTAYAIIFAGIVMVMFFITPVLGIVGLILGMLGAMALGFQPLNYAEFIGIVIIGGAVIILLKR